MQHVEYYIDGQAVRRARLNLAAKLGRRVSIPEVARACSLNRNTISQIENGHVDGSLQTLYALVDYFRRAGLRDLDAEDLIRQRR